MTIREVAQKAGVSISTVSRYLNGMQGVSQRNASQIALAIEQTNYAPSIAAQSMRNKTSKSVLLSVPDICNPFYSRMAKRIQQLLMENGYAMILFDSNESNQEGKAIQLAQQMYVSGILLASIDMKERIVKEALSLNIPLVGLNAYHECPFDTVHVHGSNGTYLAVKHLIALGHTQIGFAGGTPNSMIELSRRNGYERALKEAKLQIIPENIVERGFSQTDGYELGRYFAKMVPPISAICCANDEIAMGLLYALQERGISIPGQVSVTGMDDIPYAKITNPSLTSITNDSDTFALEGVKMLLERIDGIVTGKPRDVSVRNELIIRNSVGPYIGRNVSGEI